MKLGEGKQRELQEALHALREARVTAEQTRQLNSLLLTSAEARQMYLENLLLSAELRWLHDDTDSDATETAPPVALPVSRRRFGHWSRVGALAASLLLAAYFVSMGSLLIWERFQRAGAQQNRSLAVNLNEAAVMLHANDAAWTAMPAGEQHVGRRLMVRSGSAQLRFASGARVAVEGPAEFDVRSNNRGYLRRGKLSAVVPPKAIGFTIETPAAEIVDLGTEFDVVVNAAGETDVQVNRGVVEVAEAKGDSHKEPAKARKVVAGQAVRVRSAGIQSIAANRVAKPSLGIPSEQLNSLDLADIVAGGDGRGHARNLGISPADGRIIYLPEKDYSQFSYLEGGKYCRVDGRPFIDGVCVVNPQGSPVQLTSLGHEFAEFPKTVGSAYGPIWAGGAIPEIAEREHVRTSFDDEIDFAQQPHGLLTIFANKLITFDLAAIRRAHPQYSLKEVQATIGVTRSKTDRLAKADAWIFVDGKLKYQRRGICHTDGPETAKVALDDDAQFLTFASTESNDQPDYDWLVLGDPQIALELKTIR